MYHLVSWLSSAFSASFLLVWVTSAVPYFRSSDSIVHDLRIVLKWLHDLNHNFAAREIAPRAAATAFQSVIY